jgi:hypothetical protein
VDSRLIDVLRHADGLAIDLDGKLSFEAFHVFEGSIFQYRSSGRWKRILRDFRSRIVMWRGSGTGSLRHHFEI